MRLDLLVLVLHVSLNLLWVGSLLSVVVLMTMGGLEQESRIKAALAVYRKLSVPGFIGSFIFGVLRLGLDWKYYLVTTHFMHVKLMFVVVAIALHHMIGARLRRVSRGQVRQGAGLALGLAFGFCCLGAVALAVMKPF